jgi:large subunit ribosomal protein L10
MLKPQIEKKAQIVQDLQDKVSKAQIGILADFSGIKVGSMTLLRRQMKEAGGELTVAKNTLLKRAAGEASLIKPIADDLKGPNALVLGYEDPVNLAKLLVKFAQDLPLLKIKGGIIGGQTLTAQDVEALSKLPAREVLLAQLLGLLQSPPQALVNVLAGVIRNFLNVLVAIRDQKEESGEAAAAAPAAKSEEATVEPAATEVEKTPAETAAPEAKEAPAEPVAAKAEAAPAAAAETKAEETPAEAAASEAPAAAPAAEGEDKKG